MDIFLSLLQELGYGDDPPARALAQRLSDLSQRTSLDAEEIALRNWFNLTLNRVRRQRADL